MVFGGLLKASAKSLYSGFGKTLSHVVTKPANIIGKTIAKVTPLTYKPTSAKEFQKSTFGKKLTKAAAVPAAGLIIAAGAGGRAVSVAKSLIPKTIKGKALLGSSVYVGHSILKQSPTAQKTTEKVILGLPDKPGQIDIFTGKVAGVIEGEKGFTGKDVAKGLAVAGVVGGVVGGAAYVVPKIIKKIKGKTEQEQILSPIPTPLSQERSIGVAGQERSIGVAGQTPILPERQTIATGKKRYKRRRAKKQPSVRQSVRVNVINRSTSTGVRNTTYLKERLYN